MSQSILKKVEQKYMQKKVPEIRVGQTVEVETIIRDGDKQRIQKFKGLVIAVKGSGVSKMFTVRKISYGIGVEKQFPMYSSNIGKIKVLKEESVRRSKLYFMRERTGKSAMRVKKGSKITIPQEGEAIDENSIEIEVVSEPTEEVKSEQVAE